jgi:phosphoglycerate dehydrogenase-like enzyme
MPMARIAVLDDYQGVARSFADWDSLRPHEVTVFRSPIGDLDALAKTLAPFEVIAVMRDRTAFPAALFDRLPNLKLMVTTGARNASIDVKAAAAKGVTVCGTEGQNHPTPELSWALILGLARKLPAADAAMRRGAWQESILPGLGLKSRTLGLLGLGRLGGAVARIGAAFGMKLIAWSNNLTADRTKEFGATLVDKPTLFREADILTIHMVLGPRSRGLVGAADLALMKPTAYLVNTSRGPIVDEAALIAALKAGTIAGAGIDVYDREPLPADHPLRAAPNTVLTPHLGYVTGDTYEVFYPQTVEAIRGFLAGKPVRVIPPG